MVKKIPREELREFTAIFSKLDFEYLFFILLELFHSDAGDIKQFVGSGGDLPCQITQCDVAKYGLRNP